MAFAPNVHTLFTLYIARTCLSSLDNSVRVSLVPPILASRRPQPNRVLRISQGAFLAAMVPAESRTRFLGIVDVSRSLAAGPGPFVTGRLVKIGKLPLAFVLSAAIKVAADVGLLAGFSAFRFEH